MGQLNVYYLCTSRESAGFHNINIVVIIIFHANSKKYSYLFVLLSLYGHYLFHILLQETLLCRGNVNAAAELGDVTL